MEFLTNFSAIIQHYAWYTLWIGATFSALEFVLPKSRYPWVSRVRGLIFVAVYIAITASLLAIFNTMWAKLGLSPIVVLKMKAAFSDDFFVTRVLGYIVPLFLAATFADFFYYWFHRAQHTSSFLWKFHSVHHSIREMNAWNCNHHITEELFRIPFMTFPMSIFIAADPGPVLPVVSLIFSMHGVFVHSCTALNFGIFRYIWTDNRWHRIHHSIEDAHMNKNFANVSVVWDVLFKTAHFPTANEWPDTGVVGVEEPKTISDYLMRPFRETFSSVSQDKTRDASKRALGEQPTS